MKALFIQVPMEMNPQTKIWGHVFDFGGSPGKPGKWQKEVEATNIRDILKETPPGESGARFSWRTTEVSLGHSVQSYPFGEGECMGTGTATNQLPLVPNSPWLLAAFPGGEWAMCTGHQAAVHCNHTSEAQGHGWEASASFKGFHS